MSRSHLGQRRRDDRWLHGMNGWRVSVVPLTVGKAEYGEVTGYTHDDDRVWIVVDGEEEPRAYRWDEVRPA